MTNPELTQKIIDVVRKHQNEKDRLGHYKVMPDPNECFEPILRIINTYTKLKQLEGDNS